MNVLIIKLSDEEAWMARFREKGKRFVLVETSLQPVDGEDPLTSLMPVFASKGRQDEKIILSLPPNTIFMRQIEIPIKERRKIRELLPLELKGETAIDSEGLVFEALNLEEDKILALWCKKKALLEKIQGMANQGFEPAIVTASLFHWQTLLPSDSEGVPMAITDGEALAVYHKGRPVFFHPLDQDDNLADAARILGALEISRGMKVDRVFLHGKAARQDQESILSRTAGPVSFLPLPVSGELAAAFSPEGQTALEFAGLYALAGASGGEDPVNFRRGELAYTAGRDRARKRLRFPAILSGILALLLLAETGLRYFLVRNDLASLDRSISAVYRDIFPSRKKPVDEAAEIRSEIKRLSTVETTPAILPFLKRLAELKGNDINGFYEAEIEGNQVRLKGEARSIQGVIDFKTRASSLFTNADVGEMVSRPDGSVGFVFKATGKEERR
jgi:general secretion pathway protein L